MDTDGWKWGCVFLCTDLIMRWISHLTSSSRRGERLLTLKKNYSPFRSHVYAFSQNSRLSAQTWSRAWSRFWNPGAKSTMSMCRLHIKKHFRVSAIFHSFVSVWYEGCVVLQCCIYCTLETLVFSVYLFTDECTWNASVDENQWEVWSGTPLAQPRLRGQRHDGKEKKN